MAILWRGRDALTCDVADARRLGTHPPRLVSAVALAGLAVASSLMAASPAAHAEDAPVAQTVGCGDSLVVFNTGYNPETGQVLSTGLRDPAWQAAGPFHGSNGTGLPGQWTVEQATQIIADPLNAPNLTTPATIGWIPAWRTAGPFSAPPANFSRLAGAIALTQSGYQIGSGYEGNQNDFAYKTEFYLAPSVAVKGVEMTFSFMADNAVAAIFVNGIPQTGRGLPQTSLAGSNPYFFVGYTSGNASSTVLTNFHSGLNAVLVQTKSAPSMEGLFGSTQGYVVCRPVVEPDDVATTADRPINIPVLDNDGNLPDDSRVSAVVPDDPDNGTWEVDPDTNTVRFTPADGFVGTVTATYTVVAPDGTPQGTAKITMTVNPSLGSDVMMTSPGTPASKPVLDNDISWPDSVVTDVTGGDPDAGEWSVDEDNVVHFTPADGFAGTATATYTVTGPDGQTATGTVSVEVLGLSLEASRTPDQITAAGQDVEFKYVLTNTGAPVSGAGLSQGAFTGTGTPPELSCTYDSDGSAVANGAIQLDTGESVTCVGTYTATQGDIDAGGQVSSAMSATGHGSLGTGTPAVPVSSDSSAAGADVGQDPELSVDVDTLPIVASAPGDDVWFEVTISNTGNVTMNGVGLDPGLTSGTGGPVVIGTCVNAAGETVEAGQIALAPGEAAKCMVSYAVTQQDLDNGGDVTFAATATGTDPNGNSFPADSPPAQTMVVGVYDGDVRVPWNTPATVDVLNGVQNLPDGSTLTTVTAAPGDRSQDSWWSIDPNTGRVVFNPPPTFSGVAHGVVTVTFPDGTTGTQPVTVTVAPPTVSVRGVNGTTPETAPVTVSPQITAPSGSTVNATGDPSQGTWRVNADRTVTFTPRPGFTGQATGTVTVTAPDGTTASAQILVDVTEVPDVSGTTVTVPKGTPATLRPQVSIPRGSVVQVVGDPAQGAWTVNTDNSVTFTPVPDFTGTATATMTVTAPDGSTDTAVLRVVVTPTPIVDDASATVKAGRPVTLAPQIVAPAGSVVQVVGDPAQGTWTVNTDNTITFTPAPGFTGKATATVTVTAPDGTTDTGFLNVEVTSATTYDGSSPSPSGTNTGGNGTGTGNTGNTGGNGNAGGSTGINTDEGPASATGGAATATAGLVALLAVFALAGAAAATGAGVRQLRHPMGAAHV